MKAFFPTYEEQFTRTPNIFFDEILRDPTVTLNQVRLVGYLVRQTIGYNRDAKWAAVSRKDLIGNAGIPNGRIKEAIDGCLKKEWILTYETGKNGKQERYIFLNDPLNQRIVYGLKKGYFTVSDLKYLNLAGIKQLLEKHNIPIDIEEENTCSSTETGEGNKRSSTETVEVTPTETVEVTPTETVEVNEGKNQAGQAIEPPLNTSFKYNHLNTFDDDGSAENTHGYNLIRQMFVLAGYEDVKKPKDHLKTFQNALKETTLEKLVQAAGKYIEQVKSGEHTHAKEGKGAQIVWFLNNGWKSIAFGESTKKNIRANKKEGKLPKMLQNQEGEQATAVAPSMSQEQDKSIEEKKARVREKIRLAYTRLERPEAAQPAEQPK